MPCGKPNVLEVTTLAQECQRTCRFLLELKIDDDDKSDKKETLTGGGGYDYLTITFDSPEEKTTNFGKEN